MSDTFTRDERDLFRCIHAPSCDCGMEECCPPMLRRLLDEREALLKRVGELEAEREKESKSFCDALDLVEDADKNYYVAKARAEQSESTLAEKAAVLDWIDDALDGKSVSDFAESFPIVGQVAEVYRQRAEAESTLKERDARIAELDRECNFHADERLRLAGEIAARDEEIASLKAEIAVHRDRATGLCSAHAHGEDPACGTCYPDVTALIAEHVKARDEEIASLKAEVERMRRQWEPTDAELDADLREIGFEPGKGQRTVDAILYSAQATADYADLKAEVARLTEALAAARGEVRRDCPVTFQEAWSSLVDIAETPPDHPARKLVQYTRWLEERIAEERAVTADENKGAGPIIDRITAERDEAREAARLGHERRNALQVANNGLLEELKAERTARETAERERDDAVREADRMVALADESAQAAVRDAEAARAAERRVGELKARLADPVTVALAKCDPIWDGECVLCGKLFDVPRHEVRPDMHDEHCPWRMSRTALSASPTPPAPPDIHVAVGPEAVGHHFDRTEITCANCGTRVSRPTTPPKEPG